MYSTVCVCGVSKDSQKKKQSLSNHNNDLCDTNRQALNKDVLVPASNLGDKGR